MGSRPWRPVLVSAKLGLSLLVSNANTHRIWRVDFAQAKFTWPGLDTTSGFWQALAMSACTVATLAGHDAPPLVMMTARTVTRTTAALVIAMVLRREIPRRYALCRPWLTIPSVGSET